MSQIGQRVLLDLRGTRQALDRDTLMELPESVLLCLFPNGVNLNQRQGRVENGELVDEDEDVYWVDFDAECLQFVLDFFSSARDEFYGPPGGPRRDFSDSMAGGQGNMQNPLFHKQAIIVLREELEYFAIPPKAVDLPEGEAVPTTDEKGKPNPALLKLKRDCGDTLMQRKSIFTALQRNVNRENNFAEQHLIDMLCMSGFEREDVWGYRSLEPNRCCIASIALVLLKTGIVHPPITGDGKSGDGEDAEVADSLKAGESKAGVQVNPTQLATAQKLLLFWRKPARKCWWDAANVTLNEGTPEAREIKVWARRVWTLELSLI